MSYRNLVLVLGFALAVLAGCGGSNQPPKGKSDAAAKKSSTVAGSFGASSQPSEETPAPSDNAQQPAAPTVTSTTGDEPMMTPEQIPYVGSAPPGQLAFGPGLPEAEQTPEQKAAALKAWEERKKTRAIKRAQKQAEEDAAAIAAQKAKQQ